MKPTLLVVTNRQDFAADYVIVRLRERGLAYYRLNSDELASSEVTFRVGGGQRRRTITCGEASVDLERVRCVWYRRAVRPEAPRWIDPEFHQFAASELRHLYEGLIADPEIRWVNSPEATERAERKVYQLRVAEQHGLRIPPTIISTNIDDLAAFAATNERTICKPISQGLITTRTASFAVHTHEVTRSEVADAQTLGGTPALLQQYIPKGRDIRVTIVGRAAFPVEVITPSDAPVDWRATRQGLTYRTCTIPSDVERACLDLMQTLGLAYGAFDFVRTDHSEWYFLEVNPAGEWAWLDIELGMSMRDTLIDLLYDAN